MSSWVNSTLASASSLRCLPSESSLEHYLDGGMIPKSIAHSWSVSSLSCSDVLSCLVPLCSWIYFVLFCTQGFANPMSYVFCDERHRPNNSSPWIISAAYCCRPVLFLCSISGTSVSRSTVSLLLSFTLNQASATTSHSIVPNRGNGKFTCLGCVRGCFWAWLYWSGSWIYDSWNGLSSSHIQTWSGHYHLFLGKRLIWCLPIILIYETYLLLCSTSLWVFQSSDPQIIILKKPHSAFWCADLLRSHRCWHPHYLLLRRFSFIDWTLFIGTLRTSYPTQLADSPLAQGLWFCYCPQYFSFLHHIKGPFGVWRPASLWLSEDSQFHIPLFFPDWLGLFCWISSFLRLAEIDSTNLVNYFLGCLRD